MTIDRERLKHLAEDPNVTAKEIYEAFGYKNDVTFYSHLKRDPELREIYFKGRKAAQAGRGSVPKSAKKRRAGKKRRKSSKKAITPPRNNGAKAASKELLLKISLELDHIAIYGDTSQHFDELRESVAAVI